MSGKVDLIKKRTSWAQISNYVLTKTEIFRCVWAFTTTTATSRPYATSFLQLESLTNALNNIFKGASSTSVHLCDCPNTGAAMQQKLIVYLAGKENTAYEVSTTHFVSRHLMAPLRKLLTYAFLYCSTYAILCCHKCTAQCRPRSAIFWKFVLSRQLLKASIVIIFSGLLCAI